MSEAALGVLMLDTRFPRIAGDIGHAGSFGFPVRYRTVAGASPRRAVIERDPSLLAPFIAAGQALVDDGAAALATSCGFLVLFQRELQAALPVPVWSSSLLLLGELAASGEQAGVVTVDAGSLTADHLAAAGAPSGTPAEGLATGSRFRRTLLEDLPELDVGEAREATVAAARRLIERHPGVTSIVLECTNMPPYAASVAQATGRRVHDITTLLAAKMGALTKHRKAAP